MKNAAPVRGVALVPECNISDISGREDVAVGRQLLGLNPRPIGADGKPLPLPGSSGGGGAAGSYSMVGVADNTLPETGGPSPKGQATIAGIQLAFEGVNFVLNLVNDHIQKKKVSEALDQIRPTIARDRAQNRRLGILLLFYITRSSREAYPVVPGSTIGSGCTGLMG